ncbi:hypothetical protein HK099_000662, partial [Clydaea vesicula]
MGNTLTSVEDEEEAILPSFSSNSSKKNLHLNTEKFNKQILQTRESSSPLTPDEILDLDLELNNNDLQFDDNNKTQSFFYNSRNCLVPPLNTQTSVFGTQNLIALKHSAQSSKYIQSSINTSIDISVNNNKVDSPNTISNLEKGSPSRNFNYCLTDKQLESGNDAHYLHSVSPYITSHFETISPTSHPLSSDICQLSLYHPLSHSIPAAIQQTQTAPTGNNVTIAERVHPSLQRHLSEKQKKKSMEQSVETEKNLKSLSNSNINYQKINLKSNLDFNDSVKIGGEAVDSNNFFNLILQQNELTPTAQSKRTKSSPTPPPAILLTTSEIKVTLAEEEVKVAPAVCKPQRSSSKLFGGGSRRNSVDTHDLSVVSNISIIGQRFNEDFFRLSAISSQSSQLQLNESVSSATNFNFNKINLNCNSNNNSNSNLDKSQLFNNGKAQQDSIKLLKKIKRNIDGSICEISKLQILGPKLINPSPNYSKKKTVSKSNSCSTLFVDFTMIASDLNETLK